MNERIQALWKQAGGHYNSGNQHTWPEYTIDDPEKFAELIVRECAYLLKNSTNDKRLDLSPELFRMLNNISKAQAEYICEHFGVEE